MVRDIEREQNGNPEWALLSGRFIPPHSLDLLKLSASLLREKDLGEYEFVINEDPPEFTGPVYQDGPSLLWVKVNVLKGSVTNLKSIFRRSERVEDRIRKAIKDNNLSILPWRIQDAALNGDTTTLYEAIDRYIEGLTVQNVNRLNKTRTPATVFLETKEEGKEASPQLSIDESEEDFAQLENFQTDVMRNLSIGNTEGIPQDIVRAYKRNETELLQRRIEREKKRVLAELMKKNK